MYKERLHCQELLDLGKEYYSLEEYLDCLEKLGRIGELLGGNRATLASLEKYCNCSTSILDVGSGGGSFAFLLANCYSHMKVVGIDLSADAISFAQSKYKKDNLDFICKKIEAIPDKSFDIVTSTLVFHHLEDVQIINMLCHFQRIAKKAFIINDLHRSRVALWLFSFIAPWLFHNRLITHDGILSIKRSFVKKDWEQFRIASQIPKQQWNLKWMCPFRWIVEVCL